MKILPIKYCKKCDKETRRYAGKVCVECMQRRYSENRTAIVAKRLQWRKDNRERVREQRRRAAGLPAATRACPEKCECCDKLPTGRGEILHLDHDHITGEFRGWLCTNCNTGIGKLGDDIIGVKKALAYVATTRAKKELILIEDAAPGEADEK